MAPARIHVDHGLSGTSRARPGLDQALAAIRAGGHAGGPKRDRPTRSVPDARPVTDRLLARGLRLQLGARLHDPHAHPRGHGSGPRPAS
nr:recombinase family protein [Paracoccus salipaludis]